LNPKKDDKVRIISEQLLKYSAGNYDYEAPIGDELDEYDMIISGINMLGEELSATNVSKEYFSSIFNSVADMIAVIDNSGRMQDVNKAFIEFFQLEEGLISQALPKNAFDFNQYVAAVKKNEGQFVQEFEIQGASKLILAEVSMVEIYDRFEEFKGYLLKLRDITAERKSEEAVLKAIITTQQEEHKRVADDLHDSLGQELSMTKLMLSHLRRNMNNPDQIKELLDTCDEIIQQSIQQVREICFDLMPGVLTRGGLKMGINDLIKRLNKTKNYQTTFDFNLDDVEIGSELEIVIYRIVQEFINNMIKHSDANELRIQLSLFDNESIRLYLEENGQGFDMSSLSKIGENRGYQNLLTKTKAFGGKLSYDSKVGEGTSLEIKFPLTPIK